MSNDERRETFVEVARASNFQLDLHNDRLKDTLAGLLGWKLNLHKQLRSHFYKLQYLSR